MPLYFKGLTESTAWWLIEHFELELCHSNVVILHQVTLWFAAETDADSYQLTVCTLWTEKHTKMCFVISSTKPSRFW